MKTKFNKIEEIDDKEALRKTIMSKENLGKKDKLEESENGR